MLSTLGSVKPFSGHARVSTARKRWSQMRLHPSLEPLEGRALSASFQGLGTPANLPGGSQQPEAENYAESVKELPELEAWLVIHELTKGSLQSKLPVLSNLTAGKVTGNGELEHFSENDLSPLRHSRSLSM